MKLYVTFTSPYARLARWDRTGKGELSRDMLPQNYRIVVRHGQPFDRPSAYSFPGLPPRPERGPLWFRKMDRNRDGDLTPREFLGPPELFRKLDRDGDGLISLEEAEAYEAERAAAGQSAAPPPGERKGP